MRVMAEQDETVDPRTGEVIPGKGMAFSQFLAVKFPDTNHELTQHLHEIAAALNQHFQDFRGKPKAELSLKLVFTLEKGVTNITADKTLKLPKPPSAGAIAYIDAANNFVDDDPRQLSMGFSRSGPRAVS